MKQNTKQPGPDNGILKAAMKIVKKDGWEALSMRGIANVIGCSPAAIYEFFRNKNAILQELTRRGFIQMNRCITKARDRCIDPISQLEQMWLAYWAFAKDEKEYYQLMFSIGTHGSNAVVQLTDQQDFATTIKSVILRNLPESPEKQQLAEKKYFIFWSVVHGLIALGMIGKGLPEQLQQQVLLTAVRMITDSILLQNQVKQTA